jgi:hypothetical protein
MKSSKTRRPERTIRRSGRSPVNPYCVEEVGLTPAELARDRAGSILFVVSHQ